MIHLAVVYYTFNLFHISWMKFRVNERMKKVIDFLKHIFQVTMSLRESDFAIFLKVYNFWNHPVVRMKKS